MTALAGTARAPQSASEGRTVLRRTRHILQEKGERKRELAYRCYVVAVLAMLIVAPCLWSLISGLERLTDLTSPATVLWAAAGTAGLILSTTAIVPAYLGPAWTSLQEITFFIDGPFGVARTLARRTASWFLALGAAGAALALCVAIAAQLDAIAATQAVIVGSGMGITVCLSLLCNQAPRPVRSRITFGCTGLALAFMSALAAGSPDLTAPGGWPALAALTAIFMGSLTAKRTLGTISPGDLERQVVRRTAVTAGLSMGDSRAFTAQAQAPARRFRFIRFAPSPHLPFRTVQSDVLGILRRPGRNAAAFILTAAATALMAATDANPWFLLVALYAAHLALGTWLTGLRDYTDHAGSDRFDGDPFMPKIVSHLFTPTALLAAASVAGFLVSGMAVPPSPSAWIGLINILVIALATRIWSINGGNAPVSTLMPMMTPSGDMSSIVLLLWLARSYLPGALVMLFAVQGNIVAATLVIGTAVILCAVQRVKHLNATFTEQI